MRVTFIDVGYGDAILFQADSGYTVLLDGGSDLTEEFAGDPYRIRCADYLAAHGITHLNALLISHIHEDHVCGLMPLLEKVTADAVYMPYPVEPFLRGKDVFPLPDAKRSVHLYTKALNGYRKLIADAVNGGKPVKALLPGDTVTLTDGLTVEVLGPRSGNLLPYMEKVQRAYASDDAMEISTLLTELDATSNATSLLMRVTADGVPFVLAADYCPRDWQGLPEGILNDVRVLKLPHHGQKDAVDAELMKDMPLEYVITTSSSDRRYNSANPSVYETLSRISPTGKAPEFLFTDEREYPPYFSEPEGFHAIVMEIANGTVSVDFER